jgi:hypothetical protein
MPGVLSVVVIALVSGGVYLGALALARVPEVRELGATIRGIVRRA